MTDNNPKTTSDKEQVENKTVEKKVDKNAPLTLKEAQAVEGAEEGKIEEAIEKSIEKEKLKGDTEIAPDLKDLKKEQLEKKKEIKEKKEEVKEAVEAVEEVKEVVAPSKFEGKTEEERMEIYQEMESSFTKTSQKNKELEQKLAESVEISNKIDEYEKKAVITQQKKVPIKLPPYPKKELFYEDPDKYFQQIKEYNDAKLNAVVSPLYGQNYQSQTQNTINKLKEKTEKDVIPYKDIEKEVEARRLKNPVLVNQLGLSSRAYFYNEIVKEKLPQKIEDIKKTAVEKAKEELKEESTDMKNAEIMSSDITTQRRESKAVDYTKMLDEEDKPQKVIDGLKKKYNINYPL